MSITEGTLLTRFARTVENPESTPIDGTFPSPIPNSSDMESRRPDETAPAMTTNNPVKNIIVEDEGEKHGIRMDFFRYLRVGIPIAVITIVIATAYLYMLDILL